MLRASKEELDDEVVYLKQSFNEVVAVLNKVQEVQMENFVQDGVFSADGYSDAVPQAPHPSNSMDTSVSPPRHPPNPSCHELTARRSHGCQLRLGQEHILKRYVAFVAYSVCQR